LIKIIIDILKHQIVILNLQERENDKGQKIVDAKEETGGDWGTSTNNKIRTKEWCLVSRAQIG